MSAVAFVHDANVHICFFCDRSSHTEEDEPKHKILARFCVPARLVEDHLPCWTVPSDVFAVQDVHAWIELFARLDEIHAAGSLLRTHCTRPEQFLAHATSICRPYGYLPRPEVLDCSTTAFIDAVATLEPALSPEAHRLAQRLGWNAMQSHSGDHCAGKVLLPFCDKIEHGTHSDRDIEPHILDLGWDTESNPGPNPNPNLISDTESTNGNYQKEGTQGLELGETPERDFIHKELQNFERDLIDPAGSSDLTDPARKKEAQKIGSSTIMDILRPFCTNMESESEPTGRDKKLPRDVAVTTVHRPKEESAADLYQYLPHAPFPIPAEFDETSLSPRAPIHPTRVSRVPWKRPMQNAPLLSIRAFLTELQCEPLPTLDTSSSSESDHQHDSILADKLVSATTSIYESNIDCAEDQVISPESVETSQNQPRKESICNSSENAKARMAARRSRLRANLYLEKEKRTLKEQENYQTQKRFLHRDERRFREFMARMKDYSGPDLQS